MGCLRLNILQHGIESQKAFNYLFVEELTLQESENKMRKATCVLI